VDDGYHIVGAVGAEPRAKESSDRPGGQVISQSSEGARTNGGPSGPAFPNLFILGAPRCGTTGLFTYLGQHPDIYMPRKELHYFGTDLQFCNKGRLPLARYLEYYEQAGSERYRAESAIWYLYSKNAAAEIAEASPEAKCIVLLRDPADMLYSLHSEFVYQGDENIRNFSAALDAQADRRRGERIPKLCDVPWALQYFKVARFGEQLARYHKVFGPERVHVILYDDLAKDTNAAYHGVLRFLGIDENVEADLPVVNANKEVRSPRLRHFMRRPPASLRRFSQFVVRNQRLRRALGRRLVALNTSGVPRPPLDPQLRRRLQTEFSADIDLLAEEVGRDLSTWKGPVTD
jgi:hypothetical protein